MSKPTIRALEDILRRQFAPTALKVTDDSHLHQGHPGAQHGAGHYTITITSSAFHNKSLIERHRMVYACFVDDIPDKIHALSIHCFEP